MCRPIHCLAVADTQPLRYADVPTVAVHSTQRLCFSPANFYELTHTAVRSAAAPGTVLLPLLPDRSLCCWQCPGSCHIAAGVVWLGHTRSFPRASAVGLAMQPVPQRCQAVPGLHSKAGVGQQVRVDINTATTPAIPCFITPSP